MIALPVFILFACVNDAHGSACNVAPDQCAGRCAMEFPAGNGPWTKWQILQPPVNDPYFLPIGITEFGAIQEAMEGWSTTNNAGAGISWGQRSGNVTDLFAEAGFTFAIANSAYFTSMQYDPLTSLAFAAPLWDYADPDGDGIFDCTWTGGVVVLNGDQLWSADTYTEMWEPDGTVHSMPATFFHEIGHALGFDHNDSMLSVMNSREMIASTSAHRFVVYGDEFDILRQYFPHGVAEQNLTWLPFYFQGNSSPQYKAWTHTVDSAANLNEVWDTMTFFDMVPPYPHGIYALYQAGTGATQSVGAPGIYYLAAVAPAVGINGYSSDTQAVTASVGIPALISSAKNCWGWTFYDGTFHLVGELDDDSVIAETHENDNLWQSAERTFYIAHYDLALAFTCPP